MTQDAYRSNSLPSVLCHMNSVLDKARHVIDGGSRLCWVADELHRGTHCDSVRFPCVQLNKSMAVAAESPHCPSQKRGPSVASEHLQKKVLKLKLQTDGLLNMLSVKLARSEFKYTITFCLTIAMLLLLMRKTRTCRKVVSMGGMSTRLLLVRVREVKVVELSQRRSMARSSAELKLEFTKLFEKPPKNWVRHTSFVFFKKIQNEKVNRTRLSMLGKLSASGGHDAIELTFRPYSSRALMAVKWEIRGQGTNNGSRGVPMVKKNS
jgi:hypothetical protein